MVERRGEGWYFTHGVVIMTNSENGWGVITELEARIAAAYHWDALAKPIPR